MIPNTLPVDLNHTNPELVPSGTSQLRGKYKKDLRMFSSLGGIQSRINFLHTCISNDVIPKGFLINWKEQTGLGSQQLSSKVSSILSNASKSLMNAVLDLSKIKFEEVVSTIDSRHPEIPDNIWQKGIQNYNFCFNQTSQRLTKKIQKLSSVNSLEILLPHKCLSSFSTATNLLEPVSQPDHPPEPPAGVPGGQHPDDHQGDGSDNLSLPRASNNIFFTPDMITPIPYDVENFKPVTVDEVSIPEDLLNLCSLSPSFSPTPPSTCPPGGFNLHQELNNFKRRLAWKVYFRKKDLQQSESVEEFLAKEIETFVILWYWYQ